MKTQLRQFAVFVAAVFYFSNASPALARNCTAPERTEADRWLWLSAEDRALSIGTHLPWGMPREAEATSNERVLVQRDYVNRYDDDLRAPIWSAEKLVYARLNQAERINCFRADPRVPASVNATPADYVEPTYDQGHMTPDADQDSSETAVINTYVMTNMSPQTCEFNRGPWQILERIVRFWARDRDELFVLTGSVFDRDGDGRRDADSVAPRMPSNNGHANVAIATHFYKVLAVRNADGSVSTLSIMLPHNNSNPDPRRGQAMPYLEAHVTTIAAIERVTGLDLLPDATVREEAGALWPIALRRGDRPLTSLCTEGLGQIES